MNSPPAYRQAGNASLLSKEGLNASLPLLLTAREGGRGDEYMK